MRREALIVGIFKTVRKRLAMWLLLLPLAAWGFSMKEVVDESLALQAELEPYMEIQKEHIKRRTLSIKNNPKQPLGLRNNEAHNGISEVIARTITFRRGIIDGVVPLSEACRKAIIDYKEKSLNQFQVQYDFFLKQTTPDMDFTPKIISANSVDAIKFVTGPVAMCGN